jgi:DNA-binding transcriptional MerR regulator
MQKSTELTFNSDKNIVYNKHGVLKNFEPEHLELLRIIHRRKDSLEVNVAKIADIFDTTESAVKEMIKTMNESPPYIGVYISVAKQKISFDECAVQEKPNLGTSRRYSR